MNDTKAGSGRGGYLRVPRSRGALTGFLLIALGVWGGLIPFIGPYFNYAYTPDAAWTWTAGRFWLEILPAIATIVGGFLLLTTANRAVGVFGGYLASAAGAWFIVGPIFGQLWGGTAGATGTPVGGQVARVVEQIGFFAGLGAVIIFLAAQALGRFTVRSVRDVQAAERHRDAQPPVDPYPTETRTETRNVVPVVEETHTAGRGVPPSDGSARIVDEQPPIRTERR